MKIERSQSGATTMVRMRGRLDAAWAEYALGELDLAVRSGANRVELDMVGVEFMSSVGVGVLLKTMAKLRAVHAVLVVTSASAGVAEMLRIAKLDRMLALGDATAAAAPATPAPAPAIELPGTGLASGLVSAPADPMTLRRVGSVAGPAPIDCSIQGVALGHLALAGDAAGAAGHYGEGIVVAGTALTNAAPANRVDALVGQGHAVRAWAIDALVAEGVWGWAGWFDASAAPAGHVTLSDLCARMVQLAGGPVAGMVAGECAGIVGCWARTSPDEWPMSVREMDATAIRGCLRFAGDPMHAGETGIAAFVASADARDGLPDAVAAPVDGIRLHAHVAVAAYRPVPRGSASSAVATIIAEQPLRTVVHAVRTADAETAFVRGAVFFGRVAMPAEGGEA